LEAQYEWGIRELGIFLPIHPLLAEARQYVANPQTLRHCEDPRVALPWLPMLEHKTISELKCREEDKLALQQYMDYLGDWTAESKVWGISHEEASESQDVQHMMY